MRLATVLLFALVPAAAAAPIALPWQGRLLDSVGTPISQPTNLTVALWTEDPGSTQLWGHTFTAQEVQDGYVSLILDNDSTWGDVQDGWFADPVYIEVSANGTQLASRMEVGTVPMAAVAGSVILSNETSSTCTDDGRLARDGSVLKICNSGSWITLAAERTIVVDGAGRSWSDGTHAGSCDEYLHPASSSFLYTGAIGDGNYTIDTDANGPLLPFVVYCEMDLDGGGWTLVGKFNLDVTGPVIHGVNWRVDTDVNLSYLTDPDDDSVTNAGHLSVERVGALVDRGEHKIMSYIKQHSTQYYARCHNVYGNGIDDNWSFRTDTETGTNLGACGGYGWGGGVTCGVTSTSCTGYDANYTRSAHWMHANGLHSDNIPANHNDVQVYCGDNSTSGLASGSAATGDRRGTCMLWVK